MDIGDMFRKVSVYTLKNVYALLIGLVLGYILGVMAMEFLV